MNEANPTPSAAGAVVARMPDEDVAGLRESLDRLRTIVDTVPSMLAYWGPDQRCHFASGAYERWFGVKPETLIGKTLAELLGPDLYAKNLPFIQGALAGKPQHFEREIPDPSGGPARYSQADYVPDVMNGVVRGFAVLVTDITERRQLELRLERAEADARTKEADARALANRFERVLDAMADGVLVQDAEGRITSSNAASQEILGLTMAQLADRTPGDPRWRAIKENGAAFQLEERPAAVARRTRQHVENVLMGVYKPDGTLRWISVNSVPVIGAHGTVAETVSTLRDVTSLRNTMARAAQQERFAIAGVLAAGMGHEINNPLTYVIANIDISLDELAAFGGPSPPARLRDLASLLSEAREGADRIRKIVRGLRALSREDVALQAIHIDSALEMALSIASHELRNKVSVTVEHDGELPRALGDESRLTQVLVNLLVNAAQAFETADPHRNKIVLSMAHRSPDTVVITISDNGPGIPMELRASIFDPFFTTKPVGQGTGLGLSVSRGLMHSMKGELSLKDTAAPGATFELLLAVAHESQVENESEQRTRATGRRGRIAIIEDEPAVLGVVERILLREHDVVAFGDPRAAADALEKGEAFDVVFCDLMMPFLSGEQLFTRVCASRPELADRFVFITGDQTNATIRAFLARIPNERMEKPFVVQNLLGIARRFVDLRRHS